MITSSPLIWIPMSQVSPPSTWADLARAIERRRRHRAAGEVPAGQEHVMQALMEALVRGLEGVRPEEPLEVQSGGAGRSFLVEAWTFPGFHVVQIASKGVGSAQDEWTTRHEFVPLALR